MEALQSTQLLVPELQVVKLTAYTEVTAEPPDSEALFDQGLTWKEVQEVWASSKFAKQTAGLIEPLLDHMLSEVSGLKKDDVFDCINPPGERSEIG